jgi:hypothetical protein
MLRSPEIGARTRVKAAISAQPVILAKIYFADKIGQLSIAGNQAFTTRLHFTPERTIFFLAKDHRAAWTGQQIIYDDPRQEFGARSCSGCANSVTKTEVEHHKMVVCID